MRTRRSVEILSENYFSKHNGILEKNRPTTKDPFFQKGFKKEEKGETKTMDGFRKTLWILDKRDLRISKRDVRYSFNKVRSHNHLRESFEHFVVKAILSKLIMKKGDSVLTEYEIPSGRRFDILQVKLKGDGELIAYEIESSRNNERRKFFVDGIDEITVYIEDIPKELIENIKKLAKFLKKYVV